MLAPVSAIEAILTELKPNKVWLGFSGGLDSSALLQAAWLARHNFPEVSIQAIYVHHGLSPFADQWAEHCVKEAALRKIDCIVEHLRHKPEPGESIEQWARNGRYACFKPHIKPGDILLTAHHLDDQAETVLLQLMRGAGPKGLSAMAKIDTFAQGLLVRPFLNLSRKDLEQFVAGQNISFINDHSNEDVRYDRNFIRHQIMPILHQRWPKAAQSLAISARNCAEQEQVLHESIELELQGLLTDSSGQNVIIPKLLNHSQARRNLLLRAWIHLVTGKTAGRKVLQVLEHDIFEARADAEPVVKWGEWEFRRYQNQLYLLSVQPEIPHNYCVKWDGSEPLHFPTWPVPLTKEYLAAQGMDIEAIDWASVTVTLRKGGERCRPKGRAHSQSLKKCLQEYNIAPWLRDIMPVVYSGPKIIMVVGGFVCH